MRTINEFGSAAIYNWLSRNHIRHATMTINNLCAWCDEAEHSMLCGNPPIIEINARNSITGVPVTFEVPDWGIDDAQS